MTRQFEAVSSFLFCDTFHHFTIDRLTIEFKARRGNDHRTRCYEWLALDPAKRGDYFREHGSRWSELARLPYFDMVRQMCIDPMHNLLLGEFCIF